MSYTISSFPIISTLEVMVSGVGDGVGGEVREEVGEILTTTFGEGSPVWSAAMLHAVISTLNKAIQKLEYCSLINFIALPSHRELLSDYKFIYIY
jgi:hypothetical protein